MVKKILLDEEEQILKESIDGNHNNNKSWIDLSMAIHKLDLSKAVTISPKTSLLEVLTLFKNKDINSVIIINDEEEAIGIFTDRDIVKKVLLENIDLANESIEKYMTLKPEILDMNDCLSFALNKFANDAFETLPIAAEGKIKYSLSANDLVYFIACNSMKSVLNLPPDPHKKSREIDGG